MTWTHTQSKHGNVFHLCPASIERDWGSLKIIKMLLFLSHCGPRVYWLYTGAKHFTCRSTPVIKWWWGARAMSVANTAQLCCIFQGRESEVTWMEHFQTSQMESFCIDYRIRRRICPASSMQHLSAHQQQQRGERRRAREGGEAVSAASKACGRCFQASMNVANVVSPAQK